MLVKVLPERSRLTYLSSEADSIAVIPEILLTFNVILYAVSAVLLGRLDKYSCNVMVRVSLCVMSRVQVLVSFISEIEVNGVSTIHAPQSCPSAAVPVRVSVCVASWVQVPVSTPAVSHVA